MSEEILKKIISKKEYSQINMNDVEKVFNLFKNKRISEEEKIKRTRRILHEIFGVFLTKKILKNKKLIPEEILKNHISTKERFPYYKKIYRRIFKGLKEFSVVDLGCGVNGFSYIFFKELGYNVNYLGIDSVTIFSEISNAFFNKNNFRGKVLETSLFSLKEIKKAIIKQKKPRVLLLMKVIDSLEKVERNHTKKLLFEISGYFERIVLSVPTESLIKRKKFLVKRNWISNFIKENFLILDSFEIPSEKFFVFRAK
ncbi:MAG: hypothetical protein KatS3mg001_353 [Candidatus Pacearchaeota archaeon]|nr:MAG: hypothetical protein KatS3mg001_353 [Candidatus Pacearchaeota archaeon]